MKTSRLLITVLTVILCAFATDAAFAKGELPKPKATPEPKKVDAHTATIVSVSRSEISVKSSHDTATFRIDNRTSISLGGTRVGADGLNAGMYADVTAGSSDPRLALSIEAKSH